MYKNLFHLTFDAIFWAKKVLPSKRNHFTESKSKNYPLKHIRVLDLTRIVAGPFCTMILADLGADVIKVEKPFTGDESRKWGPPFLKNSADSVYFSAANRNKRSICIDIKNGAGIIHELAKKCDVLVENYVPGKLDKYGLDFETLHKIAPHLIYCSITGYGSKGPYANKPGVDVIAASIGGLLHITGSEDGPPTKVGVAMTDLATGLYAHGAILAALIQKEKTGLGQRIEANLLSTQVACLINIGSNYLNCGKEAKRWGTAHESIVPYQAFKTSNGYLTVSATSDEQFRALCTYLSLPKLCQDPKFLTNKDRVKNRKELIDVLSEKFIEKPTKFWVARFNKAPFPVGPVNSIKEVFADPHIKDIEIVKTLSNGNMGDIHMVGPPVVYSDSANDVRSAPPTLGQHTDDVLKDLLGYSRDKIEQFRSSKIIQ